MMQDIGAGVCLYIHIFVCIHIYSYIHWSLQVHTCFLRLAIALCMYVSIALCMYVSIALCMYVSIAVCMYVSANTSRQYACTYAYICIYAMVQEKCAGTHLPHSSGRGIYYVCIYVCISAVCMYVIYMYMRWLR